MAVLENMNVEDVGEELDSEPNSVASFSHGSFSEDGFVIITKNTCDLDNFCSKVNEELKEILETIQEGENLVVISEDVTKNLI